MPIGPKNTGKELDALLESLDISALYWIVPLIERLSQVDKFEEFARKTPVSAGQNAVFGGFRQLLRVLLSQYQSDFQGNSFLGLKTDRITDRAVFDGLALEKIPPTSERANAIKNLGSLIERVNRAKDAESLSGALGSLEKLLTKPLLQLFESNVGKAHEASKKLSKNQLLFYCGVYYLWAVGHDDDRLAPLHSSPLDDLAFQDPRVASARKQWDYYFLGYKLGLAFLWKEVLPKESKELVNLILSARDWDELSNTFGPSRDMMQKALEAKGMKLPLGHEFRRKGRPDAQVLGPLLKQAPLPTLNLNERIDELLYWYQMELIDSARSKIFSGSATLNSLLIGEVMERRAHEAGTKLQVIRFKHVGKASKEAPWFSYGILMERHGSLSDFSGWLIFMEVGGDYAGLGGTEYFLTESTIKMLHRSVEVREFEIGVKSLREYFLSKLKNQAGEVPPRSISQTDFDRFRVDDLEKSNSSLIGRLLELLTKEYLEGSGWQSAIYFDDSAILSRGQEIDVLAIDKKSKILAVVECSTNLPIQRIDDFIGELSSKAMALKKSERYSSYRPLKIFVTTRKTLRSLRNQSKIIEKLSAAEIKLLTVEDDVIPGLGRNYRREELLRYFGGGRTRSDWDLE